MDSLLANEPLIRLAAFAGVLACRALPAAGREAMTIGLAQYRNPRALRLDRMLIQSLLRPVSGSGLDVTPDAKREDR